jgi:hypothetical protein
MSILHNQLVKKQKMHHFTIVKYPKYFSNEDHLACLLFDLDNLPLDRVIQRFQKDGGVIM